MEREKETDARNAILKRMEKNERNFKIAFFGTILLETFFLIGYLWIADLSDRLHVLLLFSTVMLYSILILGMFALGTHHTRNTLRILKALELLRESHSP